MKNILNKLKIKAEIKHIIFVSFLICCIVNLCILLNYGQNNITFFISIFIFICAIIYSIVNIIYNIYDYHNKIKTLEDINGIIV